MSHYPKTILIIAFSQILNNALPIITFPLLVRAFDLSTYGMWIEATTLTTMLINVLGPGISNAVTLKVANLEDHHERVFFNALYIFLVLGIGFTLFIILAAPLINEVTIRKDIGTDLIRLVSPMVLLGSLNWLGAQTFRMRQQAFRGAMIDVTAAGTRLAAAIFAYINKDILAFALVLVTLQAVITAIQILLAYKGLPLSQPSRVISKDLLKIGMNLSIVSQANWLVMFGDRLLLSIFTVSSAVAIYSASYQITLILIAFGWPFLYVLLPLLGQHWREGDIDGAYRLVRQNTRMMSIILIPAVVGLGLIGNSLLRFLATEEFAKGGLLVGMIAAGVALDNIAINLQYLFFVQDKSHILRPIYLAAAGFNIISNLVVIPLFSYYGAGVTTLLTFAYILIRLIRASQMPINTLFDIKTLGQCLLVVVVMGIWVKLTVAPTILGLTVAVAGGGLIYMAGILMLGILSLQEVSGILRRRSSALYSKSR